MSMTIEEELISLREENTVLREQLTQRDETIQQQQALLSEQNALIQHHGEQMSSLSEQLKALQDRLAKDSHNSHLPPSSDRFVRAPKSLRKPSGKKAGGQAGHRGHHQASGCRRLMRCSFIPSANARTASTICVPNQPACLSDAR